MGILGARDTHAIEEMDRPDCDPDRLDRTYRQFALVNRVLSGWHGLYRSRVRPLLSATGPATLLDIGCGGGDLALLFARWAAADGIDLRVTGIDPDERAYRFAAEPGAGAGRGVPPGHQRQSWSRRAGHTTS